MKGDPKYNFGSERQDYHTPQEIYQPILDFIGLKKFFLDVCCSENNIPAEMYYFEQLNDGLKANWFDVCWMNPPFNKADKWVKKAVSQVKQNGCHVWSIIPARTETKYWHELIMNNPDCFVVFLRKGLGFIGPVTKKPMGDYKNPLAIVYFGHDAEAIAAAWCFSRPIKGGVYLPSFSCEEQESEQLNIC